MQTLMDTLVASQVQEMELVRQKVYNLEQTQLQIKQRYDSVDQFHDDVDVNLGPYKGMRKILHAFVMSLRPAEDHLLMSALAVFLRMLVSPSLSHLLSAMVQVTSSEVLWQTLQVKEALVSFPQVRNNSNNKVHLRIRWQLRKVCSRATLVAILQHMGSMVVSTL